MEHFDYPKILPEHRQSAHLCHTASTPGVLSVLLRKEHLSAALEYAAQLDYRQFIPQLQPEPYLRQALSTLAKSYPLAIATNRGTSVEPILEHFALRDYFSTIVNCRDVARPKPAPDMLLLAAKRLNCRPESCLFIGDSELDQQAAAAACMKFAGYGDLVDGELSLANHQQLLSYLTSTEGGGCR